jgi:hypothetical protein
LPFKDQEKRKESARKYARKHYQEIKDNPNFQKENRERVREWHRTKYSIKYQTDPEFRKRKLATCINYRKTHREEINSRQKQRAHALRLEILKRYSPELKCSCPGCKETFLEFLEVDHINGNGNSFPENIRKRLYAWLKKNDFPEGFRVLCMNCNQSRGRYGYCPHEKAHENLSL